MEPWIAAKLILLVSSILELCLAIYLGISNQNRFFLRLGLTPGRRTIIAGIFLFSAMLTAVFGSAVVAK